VSECVCKRVCAHLSCSWTRFQEILFYVLTASFDSVHNRAVYRGAAALLWTEVQCGSGTYMRSLVHDIGQGVLVKESRFVGVCAADY